MGTLSPPFILCPLSDRKELVGLSEDRLQNKAIITIGRNIAIRYHVHEQKQETSWTISRHWLTSKVVYCSEIDRYGAIMDNMIIALWEEADTTLDKVFKCKFTKNIFELKSTRELETLVIFENGCVVSLRDAIAEKRKAVAENKGLVDTSSEMIIDCDVDEQKRQVILIIAKINSKDGKNARFVQKRKSLRTLVVSVSDCNTSAPKIYSDIILDTEISLESEIFGHCIVNDDNESSLVLIGSDGKVYEQVLKENQTPVVVGYFGKYCSLKTPVVVKFIRESSTFIVYGSDPSEEGAVVFLYDLKYDVLVAKQSLKLFGTPPVMEKVGSSVMIPVGLHVLVLGFKSSKCLLSSVVGKHGIRSGEEVFEQRNPFNEPLSAWEVDKDTVVLPQTALKKKQQNAEAKEKNEMQLVKKSFPEFWEIVQQFKILEREGQPESLICNQIIPMILEANNIPALEWVLNTFTDIPENYLVMLLSFLLDKLSHPRAQNKKVNMHEIECETYSSDSRVDELLLHTFDNKELIRHLPCLNYSKSRKLVLYLKSKIESSLKGTDGRLENLEFSSPSPHDGKELESCISWMAAVLDAHYTQFVFNNESDLVDEILAIINEGTNYLDAIEELAPFVTMTYNKINFEPRPNSNSKWRTEIVTFI